MAMEKYKAEAEALRHFKSQSCLRILMIKFESCQYLSDGGSLEITRTVPLRNQNFKYERFTTLGCQDISIIKLEFKTNVKRRCLIRCKICLNPSLRFIILLFGQFMSSNSHHRSTTIHTKVVQQSTTKKFNNLHHKSTKIYIIKVKQFTS